MTRTREADFASEAMVRVLDQGLRSLGLAPLPLNGLGSSATVPLDLKRTLVEHAVGQGGLGCLPLLGRGLHSIGAEPTHLALTAAQDGHAMFLRWQRLERYIHSRHRTVVHDKGPNHAIVAHVSKEEQSPPLPAEDLVVCGVLCALLEANGCTDVHAEADGCGLFPAPDAEKVPALLRSGRSGVWHFSWRSPDRGDSTARQPVIVEVAPNYWDAWSREVASYVASKLPDVPKLEHAALAKQMTPRSFQRSLTQRSLSFRILVSEVRFRIAGAHLVGSSMPLAEVGFVSGYADQSHLTREFQRRMGLTPANYRTLFSTESLGVVHKS